MADPHVEKQIPAIMGLGFRPLFLAGCTFGMLSLVLWGLALSGTIQFEPFGHALWWHPHEMIFGFCGAIVVGFLLTAVQTWTGVPGLRGIPLLLLVLLWAAGRLLLLGFWDLPAWLVVATDVSFLPVAGIALAYPLFKAWNARNLFFVPVLLLFAGTNLMSYAGLLGQDPILVKQAYLAAIFLVVLLMVVIGGRVIPFFTARGLGVQKVAPIRLLEWFSLGSVWLLTFLFFLAPLFRLPDGVMSGLFAFAGVCHFVRALRWKTWTTLRVPLLWSLHAGYLFIPLGLILFAVAYARGNPYASSAIHMLTVGAMGNMILAMVARVSLGHTGRKLQPHPIMSLAFLFLIAAALIRVLFTWILPQSTTLLLNLSIGAWLLGFGIFAAVYWPILTRPRVDGKPG